MSEYFDGRRIPITDDFMFGYAMRQPGICKGVIECLLPQLHIDHVCFKDEEEELSTQKTLQGSLGSHSVRLDVYLDDGKSIYNVEMQTGNKRNLPKRARFYGGRIDCDQLKKSQDYEELRPTYVIFICSFDPFGLDQVQYCFQNRCDELEGLRLGDESYKIFFNINGHKGEITREMKGMMDYFRDPQKLPPEEMTGIVKVLDDIVDEANHDEDWRRKYMTFAQAQLDAEKRGEARGEARGIIKNMIEMVKDGFLPLQEACKRTNLTEKEFRALLASSQS